MVSQRASQTSLSCPADDVAEPVLSIVIPAMNESSTIVRFVKWCKEGLARAGVVGEILIVDSSIDNTAELALAHGARVLKVPKRGLGQAYKDAIPHIRGAWVIMGDADCTYDFRELQPFINGFKDGYEFVMGSRWKGSIEHGAMPAHHQYFGTPVTTWILNRLFKSDFSDIHCGMRGITLSALKRIRLSSSSWEYASEMVLKSVHYGLRTLEVPVHFYKDQEGRLSHHKRSGWFSPFAAAWINLRAMFIYGADFFLIKPGYVLGSIGTTGVLMLSFGSVTIGGITFSLYWMLLFCFVGLLGTQLVLLGWLSRSIYDVKGALRKKICDVLDYNRTTLLSVLLVLLGFSLGTPFTISYLSGDLSGLTASDTESRLAVTSLYCVSSGFLLFAVMLLVNAIVARFNEIETDRFEHDAR